MSNPIRIAFDRQNQVIIPTTIYTAGIGSASASQFPKLYLGDVRDIIIQVFDPPVISGNSQGGIPLYVPVNYGGAYAGIFAIGSNPIGNAAPTPYINDLNLAWDNINFYFTGSIDLTLAATATAMGANPTLAACASMIVRQAGIPQTIWQSAAGGITLYAPENPNAVTTNPSNPTAYFTAAETRSGFLPAPPVNGKILYLNSSDGAFTGVIYMSTDGTIHQEVLGTALPSTPP